MKHWIITFVFVVAVFIPSHSQIKNGHYVSETSKIGETIDIRFKEDSFTYKRVSRQDSVFGFGKFKINEKKLTLTFNKITERKFPKWQITKQANWINGGSSALVELYAIDRANNLPFDGAFIVLQSDSTNVVQFFTNSSGKSDFFIWNPRIINSIVIDFPGYERVKIPVDRLQNQKVSISCFLDLKQQTSELSRIEYSIENISKKGFELFDINGVQYVFEKHSN